MITWHWYIVGEADGQRYCWSKAARAFVARDESAMGDCVWLSRASARAYARRHGLPLACVKPYSWGPFGAVDVGLLPRR